MKYLKYIIILISTNAILLSSCQKSEVLTPKFDVATEIPFWSGKHAIKVNIPVKFLIDGNVDFITFYSGELGKEYQYRDRVILPSGVATTRDKGVAIKSFSENAISNFSYPYATAGTFTATFVGINRTAYGEEKIVLINVPVVVTL